MTWIEFRQLRAETPAPAQDTPLPSGGTRRVIKPPAGGPPIVVHIPQGEETSSKGSSQKR